jgi:cell division protein FtsL
MLRLVNICLFLGLVALAYVIYQVKYEARGLDEEIASLANNIESERDGVAVLRAEWSMLNRPERIERLAKKYLNLAPATPQQLLTLDTVTPRDLENAPVLTAQATPAPAATPKPVSAAPATRTALKPVAPAPRTPVQAAVQ